MAPRHGVSYFGNRYLDHFSRDLEEMRSHGFDTVVHCVTEQDLEWGMERIGELFAATTGAGMSCWADPWGLARVFGGEAHSGFLASGGRACVDDPGFLELVETWSRAVVDAGADVVFWDEPNLGACGCCSDRVVEFLDERTRFVADVARAAGRSVRNAVCLCSYERHEPLFAELAALAAVDDIGTDPYYTMPLGEGYDPRSYVGRWAAVVRAAADAGGVDCHLWIQGFGLDADAEHVVSDAAAAARAAGVQDLFFWGYRAAEVTSRIAPARPAEVWRRAGHVFGGQSRA